MEKERKKEKKQKEKREKKEKWRRGKCGEKKEKKGMGGSTTKGRNCIVREIELSDAGSGESREQVQTHSENVSVLVCRVHTAP